MKYRQITLISVPRMTISSARNIGVRNTKNELIAFIDADCVILPGWRKRVIHCISKGDIAAVGSRYHLPNNPNIIEKVWYSQKIHEVSRAKYINSGNLVVKKKIFEKIGGFNEQLITGEDAELGWRLNRDGYIVVEDPTIVCIHNGNPKSLAGFYKKQKWHAIGMFGTYRISLFDKPLIMTFAFFICIIIAIFINIKKVPLVYSILTFLSVPTITSIYRVYQYKNVKYIFHLVALYVIYYTARLHALLEITFLVHKRN